MVVVRLVVVIMSLIVVKSIAINTNVIINIGLLFKQLCLVILLTAKNSTLRLSIGDRVVGSLLILTLLLLFP